MKGVLVWQRRRGTSREALTCIAPLGYIETRQRGINAGVRSKLCVDLVANHGELWLYLSIEAHLCSLEPVLLARAVA